MISCKINKKLKVMKIAKILIVLLAGFFMSCSEDTIESFGAGKITGLVVINGSNEPIGNVKISSNPSSSTVFTNENGEFVLEDVQEGDYSVQAMKDGYITTFKGATVRSGSEVNVVFELKLSTANNRAPSTPELFSPEDGATELNNTVEFVWNSTDPEGDSLKYQLELRNDRNDEILRFSDIADTTFTVSNLNNAYRYFWQVKVSDSINTTVISEVRSFNILESTSSTYYFVREVNGNNVVFSSDAEGNAIVLTSESKNSFRPRKNTSVEKIAYLGNSGGDLHLFTMNYNGSEKRQITNSIPVNGIDFSRIGFSWSDDGESLLFPNFNKLYKTSVSGGGKNIVYEAPSDRYIMDVQESENGAFIAILETDINGFSGSLFLINQQGEKIETIIEGEAGVLDGIDISVNNRYLLYTLDVSGYESVGARQLNSKIFVYDRDENVAFNLSEEKPNGTNDFDSRFAPNEASVIFVNSSSEAEAIKSIYQVNYDENFDTFEEDRELLIENAKMPDWE